MALVSDSMEGNVDHLINNRSLKWIFVSGKGGVGKTTTSCSLAVLLSMHRENVLVISTDPAHNVSDAFDQKFGKEPTKVKGFDNIYAMEVDPTSGFQELPDEFLSNPESQSIFSVGKNLMKELVTTLPGIDEAMSFAEVMRFVEDMEVKYSVIIFDTAPTGHTLRLMSLPFTLEKSLQTFIDLKSKLEPIIMGCATIFNIDTSQLSSMLDSVAKMLPLVKSIIQRFKDENHTTFVSVCIAEFLSVCETEALIQKVTEMGITVSTVVVNQLLSDVNNPKSCDLCGKRIKHQQKYISDIMELFDEQHVVRTPLLSEEVRGGEKLKKFAELLHNGWSCN